MGNDSSHDQSRRGFLKGVAIATGAAALPGMALTRKAFGASTKTPQATVQYQDKPKKGQMCSKCMYFIPPKGGGSKGTCKVVQGAIAPQGWCMLYTPKNQE